MFDTMLNTVKNNGLIEFGDRIVIGLSGGPDSLAMTHALLKLRDAYGLKLYVVHVNHLFRGERADSDEAFVKSFCEINDLPCYSFRVDVQSKAKDMRISFEEAGRIVRYEKFEQVKAQVSANKVAVAQNKNDVVETFFINLFRGSGIDGLASIDYMRDGHTIRPLLDVSRNAIEQYCVQNELMPRYDHTNDENDYVRNKIRNEFLPYVRETFNPAIDETVSKTIHLMKTEKTFWNVHRQRLFDSHCRWENGDIQIQQASFEKLLESEKYQLLRHCIMLLKGNLKDVSFDTISRMTKLHRTGAICEIDRTFIVIRQYGTLLLCKRDKQRSDEKPELYAKVILRPELPNFKLSHTCIAIDADKVVGALQIRTRKDGDRFMPLGMKGHKKIKDYFIDEKVPLHERDRIYLVCDDEKIIWIQNMRLDDRCKITEKTNNIMIMSFQELVERD